MLLILLLVLVLVLVLLLLLSWLLRRGVAAAKQPLCCCQPPDINGHRAAAAGAEARQGRASWWRATWLGPQLRRLLLSGCHSWLGGSRRCCSCCWRWRVLSCCRSRRGACAMARWQAEARSSGAKLRC